MAVNGPSLNIQPKKNAELSIFSVLEMWNNQYHQSNNSFQMLNQFNRFQSFTLFLSLRFSQFDCAFVKSENILNHLISNISCGCIRAFQRR